MKTCKSSLLNRLQFIGLSILIFFAQAPAVLAQDGEKLLAKENLGGLKIGLGEKALAPILEKSAIKKSAAVFEEAGGEYVQTWTCAEKGLSIRMTSGASKKGALRVAGFTGTAKCTLATTKGVKIGSTLAEVRKAYGAFEDKESKEPGTFVAGSVYGGIIFTLKAGKVSEIFFGAAAE